MPINQPTAGHASRPLIVRLCNYVGDVILSVPALRLLEANGYELQLYGKGWAASLLAGEGWPCLTRAGSFGERVGQLRQLKKDCQRSDAGFQARANILLMPNSFSSAFESWRAGLKPAGFASDGRSLLLNRKLPSSNRLHALEGFWDLASAFVNGAQQPPVEIDLKLPSTSQARADQLLSEQGIAAGFICIVPFAAGLVDKQDKKWPWFAELSRHLLAQGHVLVICPGPGEEAAARTEYPDACQLTGLDLPTYAAMLKRAALVIANDTGPAHLAAAAGAPLLSLLGPTKAGQWLPWGASVDFVQGPGQSWPDLASVFSAVKKKLAGQAV